MTKKFSDFTSARLATLVACAMAVRMHYAQAPFKR